MKYSTIVFIALILVCCKQQDCNEIKRERIEAVILNTEIILQLDEMITTKDSLANANSRYSPHDSYWVLFRQNDDSCYITLIANFSYYQKDDLDGFINYRNKIITFYNSESICNQGIVNIEELNTNKEEIKTIDNYDDVIVPPHEPTNINFKITKKGEIINTERAN